MLDEVRSLKYIETFVNQVHDHYIKTLLMFMLVIFFFYCRSDLTRISKCYDLRGHYLKTDLVLTREVMFTDAILILFGLLSLCGILSLPVPFFFTKYE